MPLESDNLYKINGEFFENRQMNILIVEFVVRAYPNGIANSRGQPANSELFGLGARQSGETV